MKSIAKFFIYAFVLGVVFSSCGDDDDKTTGAFTDLQGTYKGTETVSLVGMARTPAVTDDKTVDFEKSSTNTNLLKVNLHNNLGSDITATNTGFNNSTYNFKLSNVNLVGDVDIPQYMKDWLKIDFDYKSIQKIDLVLPATNGKLDRNSGIMSFKYTGTVKFYFTLQDNSTTTKEYNIEYNYTDLKK